MAIAISGIVRDVVNAFVVNNDTLLWGVASGYVVVYATEMDLLVITIAAAYPLIRQQRFSNKEKDVVHA